MKLTYNWIKEYCPHSKSIEEVEMLLTMSGSKVDSMEKFEDDMIYEVEITANRNDCLSVIGLSREVSALTGTKLTFPDNSIPKKNLIKSTDFNIDIQDANLCDLYTGRIIRGVKVGASPKWLKDKIAAIGLRSVNNIVDITNFVLYEIGQPLHAFDLNKLTGNEIIVRTAKANEKIEAIDGKAYNLTEKMLIIADQSGPVAIAGVMGGKQTEVCETTTDILIESAYFDPYSVRETSHKLNLISDSSYRFERNVAHEFIEWASNRATSLIIQLCGGEAEDILYVNDATKTFKLSPIELSLTKVNNVLGISISKNNVVQILNCLGYNVLSEKPDYLRITPPTFRSDLTRDIDAIEEIARIYGYENIPEETKLPMVLSIKSKYDKIKDIAESLMPAEGYHQAMTMSFLDSKFDKVSYNLKTKPVRLLNYLGRNDKLLRRSLIPPLMQVLKNNFEYKEKNASEFFEIATVFWSQGENNYSETELLSFVASGENKELLNRKIAGTVFELLNRCGIESDLITLGDKSELNEADCFLKSSCLAIKVNETQIGHTAILSSEICDLFDLPLQVAICEINFQELVDVAVLERKFKDFSRFPTIERDYAFIVPVEIKWSKIKDAILKINGTNLITDIELFDIYKGKGIPNNKKSVAIRVVFQAKDRTLTKDEVEPISNKIVETLSSQFNAQLRS